MKKQIFYILLFISTIIFAQKPMVKAEIDTTNIRIGEQFQLKISVDETQNVIIPKIQLKGLEVIDSTRIDTIKNSLIRRYILTGFDSGAFYIPQQQIFVKNQAFFNGFSFNKYSNNCNRYYKIEKISNKIYQKRTLYI